MIRTVASILGAALSLAALASPAMADQVTSAAPACSAAEARSSEEGAMLRTLMLEPHKITNIADLLKLLPPEAMAKFATMQKTAAERQARDWPNLCRYQSENAQVRASHIRPRVIFIGDSITENWQLGDPSLFSPTSLDRGIGGQTTPQILLRFHQDVVALGPRVVHIMAGVNDIMGNTGPTTNETIVNNIRAMVEIAKANGIRVVLAAMTPARTFVAKPELDLSVRIATVNRQLRQLTATQKVTFVDYAPVLAGSDGSLKAPLGNDGLHPNRDGYALMRPITDNAITRAAK